MARQTDQVWRDLWRAGARAEYGFDVAGTWYGPEAEIGHTMEGALYRDPGFGNANSARLTLELFAPDVPRGAKIQRFARLSDGETSSDWLPAGVFFVDRRTREGDRWTLECCDVLRKGEAVWEPDQSLEFPLPMDAAAEELARLLGTTLDPRCSLDPAWTVDYPATGTTIRQELQWIAAAHGGNWLAAGDGALLLIPLGSEPEETSLLVEEHGGAIQLGGMCLNVG